jgi:hypothetical protein
MEACSWLAGRCKSSISCSCSVFNLESRRETRVARIVVEPIVSEESAPRRRRRRRRGRLCDGHGRRGNDGRSGAATTRSASSPT